MIPNSYEVFRTYEMDPESQDNRFNLLKFGPSAAMEFAMNSDLETVFSEVLRLTGLPQQILRHCYLQRLMKSSTYGEMKTSLLKLASYFRGTPSMPASPNDSSFTAYIDGCIERIRAYQKEQHALESSVVCGCSPIVPYAGVLKKPFVDMKVDDDVLKEILSKVTESENVSVMDQTEIREYVIKVMSDMVMDHAVMATMLMYPGILNPDHIREYTLSQLINVAKSMIDTDPEKYRTACADVYQLWIWVYEHIDLIISADAIKFLDVINHIERHTFNDTLTAVMNDLPANESRMIDELEQIDAMQQFMKDPKSFTDTNTSIDPIEMFDLQPLLNYIFTNRRFRANTYTNSAFMNMPQIAGYTYYQDLLILQPPAEDGGEINYLYTPVIDDLNGGKVVVLKYWRNGRIDALSQNEYYEEIRPTWNL